MIFLVWSERVDNAPDGRLYDCTESSALMLVVAGGKTSFPLGIYTPEERNALDASSTRPANTGDMLADVDGAVKRRYGVTLHPMPVTTTAALAAELAKPGRAFLLTGSLGHYEPGHELRQWQPKFEGGHAVCVISGPTCLFLDPLAPNKSPGVPVTPAVAAQFAWQNWEARYMEVGELLPSVSDTATAEEGDMKTTITINPLPAGSEARFAAGTSTPLYTTDGPTGRSIKAPADRATRAVIDATVTIHQEPQAVPNGTFRRIALDSPYNAGLLVDKDDVQTIVPEPPAPVDCDQKANEAVAQALADFNNNLTEWAASRPTR